MENTTKSHFVFDMDDTITDSYDLNQQVFVDTFIPYLDVSKKDVDLYLRKLHFDKKGTAMILQFEEAIKYFSLTVNPERLIKENIALHLKAVHKMKIFDSVEEVIKVLVKKDKKVSVISNRDRKTMFKILKNHKIDTYFTNIISCQDLGYEKPDPHALNMLIKSSGLPKEKFIYFGDSKTDSEFATRAGIDFVIIDHYLNQKKFYKMIIESFMS